MKVKAVTSGPKYHFKPYYGMQPWDNSGKYFLCMQSSFQHRPPTADDELTLGVVDLEGNNEFRPLAQTKAWNFQQGCMPHWMSGKNGNEIIYNDRVEQAYHAIVLNIHSKKKQILPLPIQAVSPNGKTAATLNFARWGEWRPGYGYAGIQDPFHGQNQPAEDPLGYIIFDVRDKSHEIIGKDFLKEDGHMSYHKDKKWLLTDTYPDEHYMRTLKLYSCDQDQEMVLGKFHAPPDLKGELRCDLHPCWSRDYRQVAIDSIHENGNRQVYIIDVGEL